MSDQIKYMQKLKGDKILVIGGSAGIGFAVTEACLENGCTVIISSSNPDRVNKTIKNLQDSYPSAKDRISGHACDLSNEDSLESNIKELFEKVGSGIDHVIHTAGDSLAIKPLGEVDMGFVKKAGMVRFFSVIFLAKYAAKCMNSGPKSSITLTTGAVSERPMPDWAIVNGFATGLHGLTRGFALDLKPIRVNLVSPGAVDTELWKMMSDEKKKEMFETLGQKLPVGTVASPEIIAESYLYLMKDRNITGAMISTSGGSLLV